VEKSLRNDLISEPEWESGCKPEEKGPILADGLGTETASLFECLSSDADGGRHEEAPAEKGIETGSVDPAALLGDEKSSPCDGVNGERDSIGHIKICGHEGEERLGMIREPAVVRIEEHDGRTFRCPHAQISRLSRPYAAGPNDVDVRVGTTDGLCRAVHGAVIHQDDLRDRDLLLLDAPDRRDGHVTPVPDGDHAGR